MEVPETQIPVKAGGQKPAKREGGSEGRQLGSAGLSAASHVCQSKAPPLADLSASGFGARWNHDAEGIACRG